MAFWAQGGCLLQVRKPLGAMLFAAFCAVKDGFLLFSLLLFRVL